MHEKKTVKKKKRKKKVLVEIKFKHFFKYIFGNFTGKRKEIPF